MTHDELIKRGFRWLKNTKRCSIVISELAGGREIPDVIGWFGTWCSVLLEAKVTLADFRSDQNKLSRQYEDEGMGIQRYYIVPFELRDNLLDILPDKWGLLLCQDNKIIMEKESGFFKNDWRGEMGMLTSLIRRMWNVSTPLEGVGVKWYMPIYGSNHEPRAELYVKEPSINYSFLDNKNWMPITENK